MLVDLLSERAPTLGQTRLICVDGPSGAGKTTLAAAVERLARAHHQSVTTIHMDDLYAGWEGLPAVGEQLDRLLLPLAEGQPGRYRRYDWHLGGFAEQVTVPPPDVLILEGVGAGSAQHAARIGVLVWVDAPTPVRMARGLTRDGEVFAPYWDSWARAEAVHFAIQATKQRADVWIDLA